MTTVNASAAASTAQTPEAGLRRTAHQLEGVFVEQLFKAMRQTVPHDGYADGGAGEDMFTGLFDEKIADAAPQQWHDGLAESVYRQLASRLPGGTPPVGNDAALDAAQTIPPSASRR